MGEVRLTPFRVAALVLLAIGLAALAANAARPFTLAVSQFVAPSFSVGDPPPLPWPAPGEAAVGVQGIGLVAASPGARALPTASVAKVMTALVVLAQHPLHPGQQGPTITVTSEDVDLYEEDLALDESVVPVQAGERLTEFQALEGLLLPSANNFATMLGIWDAGSLAAFVARMNAEARQLDMTQTTFVDASGFDPDTRSVPADLVRMGEAAMDNPVIAAIVSERVADLPVAGQVINVNQLLGEDGIVGVKTGNTPQAGGCYLLAAHYVLDDGQPVLVIGAVQGVPTLAIAFRDAVALLEATEQGLIIRHLVSRYQIVGEVRAPWGADSDLIAAGSVDLALWPGRQVTVRLHLPDPHLPLAAGQRVGSLLVDVGTRTYRVPVVTTRALSDPGLWLRLTRTTW
jgi:D-alanyl-D-alanine carboxypeptidase (penicillin-binding protein 5/6)